ncbi:MAG: DUF58 domain-containing protein [Planctomycetota bacterium]
MSRLTRVQEEVLACLGRVGVAARQAVESMLSGQHRSLHRGLSVDFVGHRAYQPGDDFRHLDWQVFARTDRYAVRIYQEETRLRATIVVDCSGSMAYGSGASNKLSYAGDLAAALGVLMVWQGDSVGLVIGDRRVREQAPPGTGTGHLTRMLRELEHVRAVGRTDLPAVLAQVARRSRRRGLVVLISDGGDDPQALVLAIRMLRHHRQDVLLFVLSHADEEDLAVQGMVQFQDLETGAVLSLDADRVRARYRQQRDRQRRLLVGGCREAGAQVEWVRTDEDLRTVLARGLGPRQRPRRGAGGGGG